MIDTRDTRIGITALLLFSAVLSGCSTSSGGSNPRKNAQVHTELAGLYFERAQAGIALEEIGKALKADSSYAPAYSVRGLIHMSLHEDEDAEKDFKKSLRLDDSDSDTHNNYGWFLCQRNREKESIPHFIAAIKNPLYATPARAYLNAGICAKQIGQIREAEDFTLKALQIQPGMPEALLAMSQLNFSKGKYSVARQYFDRFLENNDNLSSEQLWLGIQIGRKTGDRNAVSSYSMQLRNRFPDSQETQKLNRGE